MSDYERQEPPQISGWAIGGITFAGAMLILVGIFHAIAGLAAILDDDFYIATENYTFDLDVSAWGWIHLLVGVLMAVTGYFLFSRAAWAGAAAIAIAVLSAIANFFFIPYYPLWSILMIALACWVIWSLTQPGAVRT